MQRVEIALVSRLRESRTHGLNGGSTGICPQDEGR